MPVVRLTAATADMQTAAAVTPADNLTSLRLFLISSGSGRL